jgi:hypothetical protein
MDDEDNPLLETAGRDHYGALPLDHDPEMAFTGVRALSGSPSSARVIRWLVDRADSKPEQRFSAVGAATPSARQRSRVEPLRDSPAERGRPQLEAADDYKTTVGNTHRQGDSPRVGRMRLLPARNGAPVDDGPSGYSPEHIGRVDYDTNGGLLAAVGHYRRPSLEPSTPTPPANACRNQPVANELRRA